MAGTADLQALIAVLKAAGVTRYATPELTLEFAPPPVPPLTSWVPAVPTPNVPPVADDRGYGLLFNGNTPTFTPVAK